MIQRYIISAFGNNDWDYDKDDKGGWCIYEDVELELKGCNETITHLKNQLDQANNQISDLEDEIKRYKEAFNKFESILAGV
jgi:peptidoglycan hydrolase CwlO-like protein